MEVETVSDPIEKQIVIGLIISDDYTKQTILSIKLELFESNMCRMVAGWCVDYYSKYSTVPGKEIKNIYEDKIKKVKDKTLKKLVRVFIKRVNKNYAELGFNVDYILKRTRNYFRKQNMKQKMLIINSYIEDGEVDKAEEEWLDSVKYSGYEDLGFDPLDNKFVDRAFDREENTRVNIGTGIEALDEIAGYAKSGWLCGYIAPTKRGKTFALWHTAITAYLRGLNIVFISLETEEEDNAVRFWSGLGSLSTSEADKLEFPYFVKDSKEVQIKKIKRPRLSRSNVKKMLKTTTRMSGGRIFIKRYAMNSASVRDFERYLDLLEVYKNFSPHLICVDYLGIIKPPTGVVGRDKYDINSQLLKSVGQKRDCVIWTGHQATREALLLESVRAENTSEDIRVIANLDIGYGINQTEFEKEEQQNRYNILAHRHRYFIPTRQARNLIQLEAGQASLDSKKIKYKPKKKGKRGEL